MNIQLNLTDQVVTVVGCRNNRIWFERLKSMGVKTTQKIGKSTTLVISGGRAYKQEELAKLRGLLIVPESQADHMLRLGHLEVKAKKSLPQESIDELIGEFRGFFDRTPSYKLWETILEHVARCAPEQAEAVVTYVDGHLTQWDSAQPEDAHPGLPERNYGFPKRSWLEVIPCGEVRILPHSMTVEMMQGHPHAAHALARSIHMTGLNASAKTVKDMLQRANLRHLRELHLGTDWQYSPSLWKALPSLEATRNLEVLAIPRFKRAHADAFSKASSNWRPPLHTLQVNSDELYTPQYQVLRMLNSPACEHVTTIALGARGIFAHYLWDYLAQGREHPRELETLHIVGNNADFRAPDLMSHPFVHPPSCLRLELWLRDHHVDGLKRWMNQSTVQLPLVDLSLVRGSPKIQTQLQRFMLKHMPASQFLRHIEKVRLGQWATPAIIEAIEAHGTEVVDEATFKKAPAI